MKVRITEVGKKRANENEFDWEKIYKELLKHKT